MKIANPCFLELCNDHYTVASLRKLIKSKKIDPLKNSLLVDWLQYLTCDSQPCSFSDTTKVKQVGLFAIASRPYTITMPSGKTIPAWKYTGSSTPPPYPNASNYSAQLLKPSSYRYNCHSFSWYFGGNISGIANSDLLSIDYPEPFYNLPPSCARLVTTPKAGDIAVYMPCPCNGPLKPIHSAIIISVNGTQHNKIIVRSKWGIYGEYKHALSECPYYACMLPHKPPSCPKGTIEYYRISHQLNSYDYQSTGYHNVRCYCCGFKTHTEPHSFYYSGGKYHCSKCGYTTTKPVTPSFYDQ